MNRFLLVLAAVVSVHAGIWAADSVDDYAYLASKGIGDEVLLARLDTHGISAALSTADIVRLKEANVSERVIAALVRRGAAVSSRVDGTESKYASTATEPVIGRPIASVTQPVVRERVIEVQRTVPVYTSSVYSTPVYSSPVVYASYGYPYGYSYYGRPYYSSYYYPRYYGSYYGHHHYGHHHHHHRHGGFGFRAGFRF